VRGRGGVRVAGQYGGDPGTRMATGRLRGFLTDADAVRARLGDRDLTSILRVSDRDTLEGEPGWWFYFGFVADPVPFTP